jgi:hypothetical protein
MTNYWEQKKILCKFCQSDFLKKEYFVTIFPFLEKKFTKVIYIYIEFVLPNLNFDFSLITFFELFIKKCE